MLTNFIKRENIYNSFGHYNHVSQHIQLPPQNYSLNLRYSQID